MATIAMRLKRKDKSFDEENCQAQKRYLSERMASDLGILQLEETQSSSSRTKPYVFCYKCIYLCSFKSFNPFLRSQMQTSSSTNNNAPNDSPVRSASNSYYSNSHYSYWEWKAKQVRNSSKSEIEDESIRGINENVIDNLLNNNPSVSQLNHNLSKMDPWVDIPISR